MLLVHYFDGVVAIELIDNILTHVVVVLVAAVKGIKFTFDQTLEIRMK